MTRADLIAKNGAVLSGVIEKISAGCPDAIVIIVTNPLDVMAYMACKKSGLKREKIFGMAGVLDTSRFAYLVADALKVNYSDVDTMVLGQHGPAMVPLVSRTKVKGAPIADLLKGEKLEKLLNEARNAGSTVVKLLGKGSAYYAPSAALFHMIKAIARDEKKIMSVSCMANGEYGLNDVCTGLPVKLGKGGIEEVVKLDLPEDELGALQRSAGSTKELIAQL
jgi:malate dehydrogenase